MHAGLLPVCKLEAMPIPRCLLSLHGRPYPGLFAKCKLARAVSFGLILYLKARTFSSFHHVTFGGGHFNALKIPKEGVQLEVLFTRVSAQNKTFVDCGLFNSMTNFF
jgi:hypothetical protein